MACLHPQYTYRKTTTHTLTDTFNFHPTIPHSGKLGALGKICGNLCT